MAIGYTKKTWVDGGAPALSAANLQVIDNGIQAACDQLDAQGTLTSAGRTDANAIAATAGATLALRLAAATSAASASQAGVTTVPSSGIEPLSVAGSADTDLGRFRRFLGAASSAAALPAGGTWEYFLTRRGPNMQIVGSGLAVTAFAGAPTLAALNATDFAFIDGSNDSLKTYRFDGTSFTAVGTGLTVSVSYPKIKALSSTRIVMYDSGSSKLRCYDWNSGTGTWSLVGNELTISGAGVGAVAKLTSTTVAFIDVTNDALTTYSFDGTDWTAVGTPLTVAVATNVAMANLTETSIAMMDQGTDVLRQFSWNSGTGIWTAGGTLSVTGTGSLDLAQLSATNIVMFDCSIKKLREYRYSSGAWELVGAGVPINVSAPTYVGLCYLVPDNMPYGFVIYIDNTLDKLMAFDYDGSMGRAFEEVAGVAAGGTTVGTLTDGYYWSGWIKRIAS